MYNKFSKAELKEFDILMPPPVPAQYKTSRNPYYQEIATAKQVAAYNAWAKKLNASDNKIIKLKDLETYKAIYDIMSVEQKSESEPFPQIPPPPPPPSKAHHSENGKRKTLNEIIAETPDNVESGYEKLENGETHYFNVYQGEKTYYNRNGYITDDKGKVLPPPPPAPQPPPPPPPISPLDHIVKMAKKGANFYFENAAITSDNAIAILKSNKDLNIFTKDADGEIPKVYITASSNPDNLHENNDLPKPTAKNIINHMKVMNRHGATFYVEGKTVTYKDALKYIKKNKDADVMTSTEKNTVKIDQPNKK